MLLMSDVIDANIEVHEALLAAGEYQKSPHRRPENIAKVARKINEQTYGDKVIKHLDIGCGDGFIFDCYRNAKMQFGVDASSGMLMEAQKKFPDIEFLLASAYGLPFSDCEFDLVTCYSFLDHLENRTQCYKEVLRVLRPGGKFFFGLSPNSRFISSFADLNFSNIGNLHSEKVIKIEKQKALENGNHYLTSFGISADALSVCEPGKTVDGGLDPTAECNLLYKLGCRDIKFEMDWIVGQNKLSKDAISVLNRALPFSIAAFKYFDLFGTKHKNHG
jgi:SAM-dependent methyltransferase